MYRKSQIGTPLIMSCSLRLPTNEVIKLLYHCTYLPPLPLPPPALPLLPYKKNIRKTYCHIIKIETYLPYKFI